MKNWIKTHKKIIIALLIFTIAIIGLFFLCKALKITSLNYLRQIIEKTGVWGEIVYIFLRVSITVFLCFIPGTSMTFDLLSVALYGATIKAFIISIISISIASFIMYILGRFGGSKLFEKIIGKEDLEKADKLIKEKGLVFYPVMMACGGFPDDALVFVAGVIKMNFVYFLISTVIGRAIGCATTTFAIALIPFNEFTTFYDWFVFICCASILIFFVLKIGNFISKKINNYRKKE